MQGRSAIECHTGFAVVAASNSKQQWKDKRGSPSLRSDAQQVQMAHLQWHILVSALGAGFCTGNGFTIFKIACPKISGFHVLV